MVSASYMVSKPAPPSALMRFIDQQAIPVAIDAAGSMEMALEHAAVAARKSPLAALAMAVGFGWLIAALVGRRA